MLTTNIVLLIVVLSLGREKGPHVFDRDRSPALTVSTGSDARDSRAIGLTSAPSDVEVLLRGTKRRAAALAVLRNTAIVGLVAGLVVLGLSLNRGEMPTGVAPQDPLTALAIFRGS
jgi:hypothetical protein